jgi:hypothetical protein
VALAARTLSAVPLHDTSTAAPGAMDGTVIVPGFRAFSAPLRLMARAAVAPVSAVLPVLVIVASNVAVAPPAW